MMVNQLLKDVKLCNPVEDRVASMRVSGLSEDSRRVRPGYAFVAKRGQKTNGRRFTWQAIKNGASMIVSEPPAEKEEIPVITTPDSRKALSTMARNFYDTPADRIKIAAVTGTNGKTTTSSLLRHIMEANSRPCGLTGTIEYNWHSGSVPAPLTTPAPVEYNHLLAKMLKAGCQFCASEISSHALSTGRVEGIAFHAAVFTNLSQDHLDFHQNMDGYYRAKRLLFENLPPGANSVINLDDPAGKRLKQEIPGPSLTYAVDCDEAQLRATRVESTLEGLRFELQAEGQTHSVVSPLRAQFNVYNILAAIGAALTFGLSPADCLEPIKNFRGISGRMQPVPNNRNIQILVDYAHTPDALEKALQAARKLTSGKLICVFGCGGERDREKRPLMGKISARCADLTIITSDNPRGESPQDIITEIIAGTSGKNHQTIRLPDRRQAIEAAILQASSGDSILIAGKGHESYQIIGSRRLPFSDQQVCLDVIEKLSQTPISSTKR